MSDKKLAIKLSTLEGIGNAVREKEGSTDAIPVNTLADRIGALQIASGENKLAQLIDKSITEVTAEDLAGVITIGDYAFYKCNKLVSVTIPDHVKDMREYAFAECTKLTSVTIPNGCTTLAKFVFYRCSNLKSITIPNTVTRIMMYAFTASGLTSITIPTSVTYVEMSVFDSVSDLKEVYYEGDIESWLKIHFSSTASNPMCHARGIYVKNTLGEYELLGENLEIPDTITELDSYTLTYCESLKSVTIPNSVTKIGIGAFQRCRNLSSITISNSVTSIGNLAFSDCNSLTSVTIPNSVTSIGDESFYGCSTLTNVRIGNGITSIHNDAFRSSRQLTDIYIDKPEGSISGSPWGATNATVHWNTPLPSEEV